MRRLAELAPALPDPDRLRTLAAQGDREARETLLGLLQSPHPYTHANAAVILAESCADAPEFLRSALLREGPPLGVGAAILLAELHAMRAGTEAAAWEDVARAVLASGDDTISIAFDFLAGHPHVLSDEWLRARALGDDERLAWQSAETLHRRGGIDASICERMFRVKGSDRDSVLLFLAEVGEPRVVPELVRVIVAGGFASWLACDAIERLRPAEVPSALAVRARRRLFVDDVAVRAASCLAALGEADAMEWLRRYAGSSRERVRWLARTELARVGTPDVFDEVVRQMRTAPLPSRAWFVQRLGIMHIGAVPLQDEVMRLLIEASEAPEAEIREAAVRGMDDRREHSADARLLNRLHALRADPSPDVRSAVDDALAPTPSPWAGRR